MSAQRVYGDADRAICGLSGAASARGQGESRQG